MTVNLGEHQVGFDAQTLGFPSIYGCMAIVAVLPGGLYGYHSYGGETKAGWDQRAPKFKKFITDHGGDPTKATRLYGITHVTNQRGWGNGVKKQLWLAELQGYAAHLGTNCRISGYNLDDAIAANFHKKNKSAYVEFRKAGGRCSAWVETWENVTSTTLLSGQNPWGDDIKTIRSRGGGAELVAVTGDIFDPINTTNALKQISKSALQR